VTTEWTLAAFVRANQTYIDKAVALGVNTVSIADKLADVSDGQWSKDQIAHCIYKSRSRAKEREIPSTDASILESLNALIVSVTTVAPPSHGPTPPAPPVGQPRAPLTQAPVAPLKSTVAPNVVPPANASIQHAGFAPSLSPEDHLA
jgi:hypothetical protein